MGKITLKQRKRYLGWFSQQPRSAIETILESANENFYRFRERMPGAERRMIRYEAFIYAIKDAYNLEYSTKIKNPDHDLQKVLEYQEEKIKHFAERRKEKLIRKRKSKKRDLILRHMPEIELMRRQGVSYPGIAEYLQRYKLQAHPSYVQQLVKEYTADESK